MRTSIWISLVLAFVAVAACRRSSPPPGPGGGGGGGGGVGGNVTDGGLDAGGCTIGPEVLYEGGAGLVALAAGRLDADARPELVAVGGTVLRVFRAQADAGLEAPETYATASSAVAVAAADFDDDGRTDVAVVSGSPQNGSQLFAGIGDGGLETPAAGTGRTFVQAIAAGDFDEDDRPDLALATDSLSAGEVTVLLNPAAGAPFSQQRYLDFAVRRAGIASADFDGDDHLDLVASDPANGQVTLFLGEGDGDFTPRIAVSAGAGAAALAAGDVDGDGTLDVVAARPAASALSVLRGTDGGTFATGEVVTSAGGQPVALALGTWSPSGGTPGAVTAEVSPARIGFYRRTDDGLLEAEGAIIPSGAPRAVALVDVDADGRLDVVALLETGLAVYRAHCP